MLKIRIAENMEMEKWDDYISNHSESSFYHQWLWQKVVAESLSFEPLYFLAEEKGIVQALLPLFRVESKIWGNWYCSAPAANYCGMLFSNESAAERLLEEVLKKIEAEGLDFLQLRSETKYDFLDQKPDNSNVLSVITLSEDINHQYSKLKKEVRKRIRQAESSGLKVKFNSSDIKDFYEIYAKSMHRLGSPPFGIEFFQAIKDNFENETTIVTVEYDGKTVAADFLVGFKSEMLSLFAGSLADYHYLNPNYLLLWKEVEYATKTGYHHLNLGRSRKNSSVLIFKENFNAHTKELYYYNFPVVIKVVPERNIDSPLYRVLSKGWQFLPFSLTKKIGPKLVKFLH